MGSRWFLLLLLLLLNGDRIFNLPGNVASIPPSSKGVELNKNLSCPSTSSVVSQRTNGPTSTKELNSLSVNKATTSQSQGQMTSATLPTSPQSSSETETTEQTVHTAVKTVTNSMSLLDPTVTSAAKELVETSKTAILFTVATPPSSTPDKAIDTNEPLHTATVTTRDTSSPTTANLRTTVLSTATSETQERDTTTVPPTPATSPTMTSKPQDTYHSIVTQTPSQPAQMDSSVSRTELTTLSPPRPITTGMRFSVSPSPGEADMTVTTPLKTTTTSMTPSTTSSTAEDAILSSGTRTPTVPEKLTLTAPSSTPDKAIDTNKPLHKTTVTTRNTSSPTTANLRTTVLSTATPETQERDTTTVPPTPATGPTTTSMSPDTHHSTVTQTPSQPPAQTNSSVSLGTTQSLNHSTALVPSSSETTKSSTMIGTTKAPSNSNQSSGPGGGACALDEYQASTGGCACNDSYYSHLELSREIATLRCRSQDIEVSLLSCFLKTQHWVLKQDAFSKCFHISTTEEGHRVQVVQVEKKEGTCGLHISTNSSYAVHSLNVHLEQALPGSSNTNFRVLHFSCAYPLAVDVSKPVSHLEISIPSIHVPSSGETVVTLSIFTDSKLSAPLKNSTAPVGLPLYVVLKSTNNDPDRFVLVANEIFASTNDSNAEANDSTYHFVKESCPVHGRMLQDLSNGASMDVTLAFTVSRFLNSDMLYLHAKVTLCDKQIGHPCQPSCSGKNPLLRNSPSDARTGTQKEPSGGKWIVFGPLRISESQASSSGNSAGAWISIFLLIMIGSMLE
ncbi:mucin-2-like [Mus caroli]|uniref:Mucin-2-like n=1 Tax=Mus caroli TaxID=10089 RepID=A0A6P5PP91_MUSCR|nr:mucin-2-like [Mus caroli]